QLLVGDQEQLVNRVTMGQLVYIAAAHAFPSFPSAPGPAAGRNAEVGAAPVERSIVGASRPRGQVSLRGQGQESVVRERKRRHGSRRPSWPAERAATVRTACGRSPPHRLTTDS